MSLRAELRIQQGQHRLEFELTVASGETVAIVGPNGAGKSSFLHAVAGLLPGVRGNLTCASQTWLSQEQGIELAPHLRSCGVMFQDLRLFPHMNLRANLAYPLRAQGMPRKQAEIQAEAWLDRVQLSQRARAFPDQLSGGEQQRAALARAFICTPQVLLLDEPLAAVDASRRIELRRLLAECLAEFDGPCILVSHDAVDALSLADRVAVFESGRVSQLGSVAQICAQPGSDDVADFVGLKLLNGVAHAGTIRLENGADLVVSSELEGKVSAVVHPRAIALYPQQPSGSPRNIWPAQVESIESIGDRLRVRLAGACPMVAEITPSAWQELKLQVGARVWLSLKATEISVFAR